MSFIYYVNPSVVNATCINIIDLKNVTMMNFIAQIIGTVCTVLSMTMVCFMYYQPCCKKNKVSPEEALIEFLRGQQQQLQIQVQQ
jgi:hypothetical protein